MASSYDSNGRILTQPPYNHYNHYNQRGYSPLGESSAYAQVDLDQSHALSNQQANPPPPPMTEVSRNAQQQYPPAPSYAAPSYSQHDQRPSVYSQPDQRSSVYNQHPQAIYTQGQGQGPAPTEIYGQQTYAQPEIEQEKEKKWKLTRKAQKRLYWIIPLVIVLFVLVILYEVYKKDFERWLKPVSDWLEVRKGWSWIIPVILVVLSFPPLFGHEIVLLIVGMAYSVGIAIGIACAGSILGEALVFIVFKLFGKKWVNKKRAQSVKWEATGRVAETGGWKLVMLIRYSILPPHLVNPLFATTEMSFWLYLGTVILALPRQIVIVVLGTPSNENERSAKIGKAAAIFVFVLISIYATYYVRTRLTAAKAQIRAERGIPAGQDKRLDDGLP